MRNKNIPRLTRRELAAIKERNHVWLEGASQAGAPVSPTDVRLHRVIAELEQSQEALECIDRQASLLSSVFARGVSDVCRAAILPDDSDNGEVGT